jgi:hypothetical protein
MFVAAFLLSAAAFVWGCFYIPEAQFRWTVEIGGREFGLCHIKALIYFAVGDGLNHQGRIYVSSAVAAAILAIAAGVSALFLLCLTRGVWSRMRKHD